MNSTTHDSKIKHSSLYLMRIREQTYWPVLFFSHNKHCKAVYSTLSWHKFLNNNSNLVFCSCTEGWLMFHLLRQLRVFSPLTSFLLGLGRDELLCILFIPTTRPGDVRLVMILFAGSAPLGREQPLKQSSGVCGRRSGSTSSSVSPPSALHVNNSISPAAHGSVAKKCSCQTWKAKSNMCNWKGRNQACRLGCTARVVMCVCKDRRCEEKRVHIT